MAAWRALCGPLLALGLPGAAAEIAARLHAADPRLPRGAGRAGAAGGGRRPRPGGDGAAPRRRRTPLSPAAAARRGRDRPRLRGVRFAARRRRSRSSCWRWAAGGGDPERQAYLRFAREAEAAGRLRHPNIVALADAQPASGLFVFELMTGGTLADRLATQGPLPLAAVRRLALDLLAALGAAHERGIVHRDVKPANVFYDAAGNAKLGDFGSAHLADFGQTQTGGFFGTVAYMSPEQITGAPIGYSADLYALGATLVEALTSRPPFLGPDLVGATPGRQAAPPRRRAGPASRRCTTRCSPRALAKAPGERFASAIEMAEAVAAWPTEGAAYDARRHPPRRQRRPRHRRSRRPNASSGRRTRRASVLRHDPADRARGAGRGAGGGARGRRARRAAGDRCRRRTARPAGAPALRRWPHHLVRGRSPAIRSRSRRSRRRSAPRSPHQSPGCLPRAPAASSARPTGRWCWSRPSPATSDRRGRSPAPPHLVRSWVTNSGCVAGLLGTEHHADADAAGARIEQVAAVTGATQKAAFRLIGAVEAADILQHQLGLEAGAVHAVHRRSGARRDVPDEAVVDHVLAVRPRHRRQPGIDGQRRQTGARAIAVHQGGDLLLGRRWIGRGPGASPPPPARPWAAKRRNRRGSSPARSDRRRRWRRSRPGSARRRRNEARRRDRAHVATAGPRERCRRARVIASCGSR